MTVQEEEIVKVQMKIMRENDKGVEGMEKE